MSCYFCGNTNNITDKIIIYRNYIQGQRSYVCMDCVTYCSISECRKYSVHFYQNELCSCEAHLIDIRAEMVLKYKYNKIKYHILDYNDFRKIQCMYL